MGYRSSELLFLDNLRTAMEQVPICRIKGFIYFRQSTQNAWLCPAKFFGKFFSDTPFYFFRNRVDVLFNHHRVKCVLWLTVPWIFWCFSWNCYYQTLFLNAAMILREKLCKLWRLSRFLLNFLTKYGSSLLWRKMVLTKAINFNVEISKIPKDRPF